MLVLIWAGTTAGLMAWMLGFSHEVLVLEERMRRAGSHVWVVSPVGASLPAGTCASLEGQPWVIAAGGVQTVDQVRLTTAPVVIFQRAQATSGAVAVWTGKRVATDRVVDSYLLASLVARETGLRPGLWLHVIGGSSASVGLVVEVEERYPVAGRWIIEVIPPHGTATQCWIEVRPSASAVAPALFETWFADADVEVRPLRRDDEFTRDPAAELAGRPHRSASLAAGVLVSLAWWVAGWFRRSEYGLYLALGLSRTRVLLLAQFEVLVVGWLGFVSGVLWGAAIHLARAGPPTAEQVLLGVKTSAAASLFVLAIAPLASVVFARGSVAALLKDR
jgi:hypothetical protein